MTLLLLGSGILFLVAGAEVLVRGASRLALAFRIPPLIVGLTVVSFGTSSPELAVSTSAALSGNADIAIGNVVGSNIFNVLLILGLSALVAPLRVSSRLVRLDVPVMVGVSVVVLLMALDGRIDRLDGGLLLVGMVAYLAYLFRSGRREGSDPGAASAPHPASAPGPGTGPGTAAAGPEHRRGAALALDIAFIAAGLVLLVIGSGWLVDSARVIAGRLGVSELMIGLTVVAAGTSLPELATSLIAAVRGERDIAVGNVVGSNIFNILAILGVAAVIAPAGVGVLPAAMTFDIPVMTAVAVVCMPVFFSGGVIARWEGALFVASYVAYTAFLALDSTGHRALPVYRDAMLYVVLPLTLLVLVISTLPGRRGRP